MSYPSSTVHPEGAPRPHSRLPIHEAHALTGEDGTALITLGDKTYTLRITRAGKLILTK